MKLVWLPHAQRDLETIIEYHQAVATQEIAFRVVRRIAHSATTLLENPFLGRPSDAVDGVHELHVVKLPYLLPYRVIEDRIEILRVFHEAQGRPSSWQV